MYRLRRKNLVCSYPIQILNSIQTTLYKIFLFIYLNNSQMNFILYSILLDHVRTLMSGTTYPVRHVSNNFHKNSNLTFHYKQIRNGIIVIEGRNWLWVLMIKKLEPFMIDHGDVIEMMDYWINRLCSLQSYNLRRIIGWV